MSSPNPPADASSPAPASNSESAPLLADSNENNSGNSESIEVDAAPPVETWEDIPDDVKNAGVDEVVTRARLIDNDIRVRYCLPK